MAAQTRRDELRAQHLSRVASNLGSPHGVEELERQEEVDYLRTYALQHRAEELRQWKERLQAAGQIDAVQADLDEAEQIFSQLTSGRTATTSEQKDESLEGEVARYRNLIDEKLSELEQQRQKLLNETQSLRDRRVRLDLEISRQTEMSLVNDPKYAAAEASLRNAWDALVAKIAEGPVLDMVRRAINDAIETDYAVDWDAPESPGLSSRRYGFVETDAFSRVRSLLRRHDGASIGISGPRGSGKTTLIEFLCETEPDSSQVGILLAAPIDYEPRDFVLYAYSRLCLEVGGTDDPELSTPTPDPVIKDDWRWPAALYIGAGLSFAGLVWSIMRWSITSPKAVMFTALALVVISLSQLRPVPRVPSTSRVNASGASRVSSGARLRSFASAVQRRFDATGDWLSYNASAALFPGVAFGFVALAETARNWVVLGAVGVGAGILTALWTLGGGSGNAVVPSYTQLPAPTSFRALPYRSVVRLLVMVTTAGFAVLLAFKPDWLLGVTAIACLVLTCLTWRLAGALAWNNVAVKREHPPSRYYEDLPGGQSPRVETHPAEMRLSEERDYRFSDSSALAMQRDEIAKEASRRLNEIRYQQTLSLANSISGTFGGGLGPMSAEIARETARETSRSRHPQTFPEIVHDFREFLEVVRKRSTVIIGIDELDKMDGPSAARFLNGVKAVFGVPGCHFLVSVSEDAVVEFERRGAPFRTVFDSAFDEIVRIDRFDYDSSVEFCAGRVIGLPRPAVLTAHVLSTGLPRELLRTLRLLVPETPGERVSTLHAAFHLLGAEGEERRQASLHELSKLLSTGQNALANASYISIVSDLALDIDGDTAALKQLVDVLDAQITGDPPPGHAVLAELSAFLAFRIVFLTLLSIHRSSGDIQRLENESGRGSLDRLVLGRRLIGVSPSTSMTLLREFSEVWCPNALP